MKESDEFHWHLEQLFSTNETTCPADIAEDIVYDTDRYGWYVAKYPLQGSNGKLYKLVLLDTECVPLPTLYSN